MRRAAILAVVLAGQAADATEIVVPSGQLIIPYEVLDEAHGAETWLILRFLAPAIARDGGDVDFASAEADLDHLCRGEGLEAAELHGSKVDQIVITLLDRPLERGESDPEVTQFFGAYRVVDNDCIWEPF